MITSKQPQLMEYIYDVLGALIDVHKSLGPGLLEAAYQEAFEICCEEYNISYEKEPVFPIFFHNKLLHTTYRGDFLVKGNIIVEMKAVSSLNADHKAQLINYMRITRKPIGILVNFSEKSLVTQKYYIDPRNNQLYVF